MKKLNIVVVIVSDTRTDDTDKSGKKLKHLIENDGHAVLDKTIVKDNIYEIRKTVSNNIVDEAVHPSYFDRCTKSIAEVLERVNVLKLPTASRSAQLI